MNRRVHSDTSNEPKIFMLLLPEKRFRGGDTRNVVGSHKKDMVGNVGQENHAGCIHNGLRGNDRCNRLHTPKERKRKVLVVDSGRRIQIVCKHKREMVKDDVGFVYQVRSSNRDPKIIQRLNGSICDEDQNWYPQNMLDL